jgi:hypothetical protein
MKLNLTKKETLIKQLHEINWEVHLKPFGGEATGDLIGFDDMFFVEAMRYVPNHVIKKWIKKCKTEVKQHKEEKNENPTRT